MLFRGDDRALRGGDNGNRVFLTERFLDFLDGSGLAEGQARGVRGAEEDVHIGEDGLNAGARFLTAPEVCAVIDVKGNQSALLLKLTDAVDGKRLRAAAEPQCDSAGMKQARIVKHSLRDILDVDAVDGRMEPYS